MSLSPKHLWLFLAATLAGCAGPAGRATLEQPGLAPAEQRLELATESAAFDADGEVARLLIAFPLPGATRGRNYEVYLRCPAREGTYDIGEPLDRGFVGGFLVQSFGRHFGLTEFTAGQVKIESASRTRISGRIAVRCGDGSRLSAEFSSSRDRFGLIDFEQRRHSGDVSALIRGGITTSKPVTDPG